MISPFQPTIDDMNKYIGQAQLGMDYLKLDEQLRPSLKPDVDQLDKLFKEGTAKISDLEEKLECEQIHEYYERALESSCSNLKPNVFLNLIFQWSAIILVIISRTCKWRSLETNEGNIQVATAPTMLLLDGGDLERGVISSANFGPALAPSDVGTMDTGGTSTIGETFLGDSMASEDIYFRDSRRRSLSHSHDGRQRSLSRSHC